jgi:O-antigen ligase
VTPTPIGIVVLALCVFAAGNATRLAQVILVAGVFEAAAAVILGPLGVQPGLVPAAMLVALVGAQYLAGRRSPVEGPALRIMAPLLVMFAYAALTALLLPEVFAGRIIVWPQKLDPLWLGPVPLAPDQGNMNQVVYLAANVGLSCAAALAFGRAGTAWAALVRAYLFGGWLVVGIAGWEFVARTLRLPFPRELFYSNPGWAIVEQSLGGMPRLQSTFAEPSALGYYLVGVAFACTGLCLRGRTVMRADILLVLVLVVIFLSTSTTGIAAVALGLPAILAMAALRGRRVALRRLMRTLAMPLVAATLGAAALLVLRPELLQQISDVVATTLGKGESDSFAERSAMNAAAWDAFVASGGLGIGWGSTRASSLIPGLLAGAGLVGLVTVLWFALRLRHAVRVARTLPPHPSAIAMDAFGAALAGQLLAGLLSAPVVTSPIFFVQLGILAAAAVRARIDARQGRDVLAPVSTMPGYPAAGALSGR